MGVDLRDQIGFVVIGRNEGDRLVRCLQSILREVGEAARGRIVYVDSDSTDGSPENAQSLNVRVVRLDPATPLTAARGRNEGFKALLTFSSGIRYVQFIDGDCELMAGWCEAGLNFLSGHERVAVACGRLRERHPDRTIYNRLCDAEWAAPAGETTECGGVALARADAIRAVDGYRVGLAAGEEPELCVRLRENGWRVWRLDAGMAHHDAAMTRFSQWWRRMVRNGAGTMEVYLLHHNSRYGIWGRQFARTVIWGGALPLLIGVASAVHLLALFALLIYPAQIARIAVNRGGDQFAWAYAFFMTIGKFAEFQGVLKHVWRRIGRKHI